MAHSNSASGPPPITHLAYRPDIDGIRAVAVLSVVCYHAYPQKFFSGFIGVDIFFVISGFLITTILLGGLQKRQFNLLDFYDRRIRRIFPALLVLLLGASFVLNVTSLANNPVAAFYSPQTRFWELIVGALLAYLPLRTQEKV